MTETENAIGHTTVKMRKHPLTPKKIMVAVGIPDSYFLKVWQSRNPGQDPATVDPATLSKVQVEEETKIRKHVATVINNEELSSAEPLVTVTAFAHLKPAEIESPSLATQALGWLGESYASLGMIGLALFSLLMLRSMVTSAIANAPPAAPQLAAATIPGGPAPLGAGGDAGGDGDASAANKLKRRIASGPSMQDELTDLVREDPDAAANILRGWIGKVG